MLFDLVLKNGRVLDGAGNPWFNADVAIKNGRIAKIGQVESGNAERVIDVSGLMVSPGFIDIHTHSDTGMMVDPKMESRLRQGITTDVNGQCGSSPAPVNEKTLEIKGLRVIPKEDVDWTTMKGYFKRLERKGISQNAITLVGHGTVRIYVMGDDHGAPTPSELDEMKELVREAMEDGAAGLSTGLAYSPGCYAHTDEIVELAKVTAEYGGIYATHLRESCSEVLGWKGEQGTTYLSIDEAIDIGRRSGMRAVQLSHLSSNTPYSGDPDLGEKIHRLIDESREEGIDVTADILPSDWGSVAPWPGRSVFSPQYLEDGKEKLLERLKDPEERAILKEEVLTKSPSEMGFEKIRQNLGNDIWIFPPFNGSFKNPEYERKTLDVIAEMKGKDLLDSLFDLLVEEDGNICVANKVMDDRMSQMTWNTTMPSTDGGGIDKPEEATKRVRPSAYSGFSNALIWVREKKLISLEDMVRRMTSMPARTIALKDRGLLKEGFWADITVFDLKNVRSLSTYENDAKPAYPEGIPYVVVNGVLVIENSEHTGALPGKVLRHPFDTS
jgi:N-acyl-D-aspartate/D-glutamate deacylase